MKHCIWFFVLIGIGCSKSSPTPANPPTGKPQRIVSLTPGLTEMLFALGAADRVVGVSGSCNFPDAAKAKKPVGGPGPLTLSAETILSLKPDLILADKGFQSRAVETLSNLRLPVKAYAASSVSDVVATMKELADVVGATDEGRKVIAILEADAERLKINRYADAPKVFYLVDEQPLITAGPGSFTHEIVERAGGRNLFGDVREQYPTVSEEELLRRNPDVIVLVTPKYPEAKRKELLAKPAWQSLSAIKSGRIVFVDEDRTSRPGPRIFDAIRELELALHPKPNP